MYRFKKIDYLLVVPYILLCAIGVIMVYSASANVAVQNGSSPIIYLFKQLIFVLIGIGITGFMTAFKLSRIRTERFLAIAYIIFLVTFIGLLIVGKTVNGAAGWIILPGFSIQPAEFVKYYLIIAVAQFLAAPGHQEDLLGGSWWYVMGAPLGLGLVLVLLVLLQPDMGSATIIVAIIFIMCLSSGISFRRSIVILGGAVAGLVLIVFPLALKLYESGVVKSYKLARLVAFVDPFGHARTSGQQLVNSYYALSNGGLFGVGLGNSIQKRGYLPEPNTDFIMAITGEELGAIGVSVILILLGIIIWRSIQVGIRAKSSFNTIVCYGIATYFAVQATINVGGVVGYLPITGVTFPFISYGGSSMISLTLCLGTLLNISGQEREKREF
ncbi:cell division protein FtsW [Secundilactobacillus odoratitofui DSM 19909 = JCM 15043]|uniref:Probable peptidoglycan glycosyltransferase FtsW n=1 Tax=Secundilactobacillus odoratitofui DSM 19909 = JCM 15043 TaxID=1423776 RepID=A0A0R1M0S7_9LACO|nr:putative peptidoglycan glycosyltransferase FtsW [Secundilactobacillus odoratitofui]KRK98250.1 cell division protein FtsW [Secundilactobacillus odoratitofui DSM 19909 = JCM 15043]